MRTKVQGRLMQARLFHIHQVFAKQTNKRSSDTFLTDLVFASFLGSLRDLLGLFDSAKFLTAPRPSTPRVAAVHT